MDRREHNTDTTTDGNGELTDVKSLPKELMFLDVPASNYHDLALVSDFTPWHHKVASLYVIPCHYLKKLPTLGEFLPLYTTSKGPTQSTCATQNYSKLECSAWSLRAGSGLPSERI